MQIEHIIPRVRKAITRTDVLIVLALIALYFFTRVLFLDGFPIFSDEGIYIHWAKIAWHDANWRFISLTDGKQPLQTWGTIPLLKLFASNLLFGGRMFAVMTGFAALSGIFTLLYYLFGKKAAYWGALLYILTPYFVFYDRLALVDSGVNAGFIWILFISIVLARNRQLDGALLFGLIGGIAMLAKSSVRLAIGLAAFAPVLFLEKNTKKFMTKAVNYYILYAIGAVMALAIYNIQRLSPFFHFVSEKNNTFVVSLQEFIHAPFAYFVTNIYNVPLFVWWESGFILPVLGILGLIVLYKTHRETAIYLLFWIIIPYIIVAFVSKILFPRYLIFFPTLFLIPAAYYLSQRMKTVQMVLLGLIVLISLYMNYTIIADYKNIPFPPVDRGQYIEDWPAGWGMKEVVQFAREKSVEKPVILLAEGNFGMAGDVLDSLLKPSDLISIQGYWPLGEKELRDHQKDLKDKHVYVVFSHRETFDGNWPIRLIQKFEKPGGKSSIYLFELTP